ncbi:DUF1206 domain-containing protein [Fulvivirga sp. M361]|uniref:DUF1206 domain-containing protein n=1 Tax=Fulvivirga sp. M361 TaxID=2594266 RepID=UPI002107FD45|nr:DUF1206 domain-containing protein [Fulvivirga sp. M361]
MSDGKRGKFARFGIATKGFVYCLIGGLTAMTAVGWGGEKTGSSGALDYLVQQPFGQVILIVTVAGLAGFVFWRFYQAFFDPEGRGTDIKGVLARAGFFISGAFYGFLAYTALSLLLNASSSSGGSSRESYIADLLSKPYGQILVAVVGLLFMGKAIYQFYIAYSGKFKEKIEEAGLGKPAKGILLKAGIIGHTSRGIIISIVSYLTFKAAFTSNSDKAGGTGDALDFLQNEFGTFVLAIVALGLMAYGLFMFLKAKYCEISFN